MDRRSSMGLMMGMLAGVDSLGLAAAEAPAPRSAPAPVVERSLADLEAFHTAELEAQLALWDSTTDPLGPFFEPAPDFGCDDGAASFHEVVDEVTASLHRRRIPYRSASLADCSGIAHRVLRTVAGRCEGVARPPVRVARRAKDLARWYERQGLLARVTTPHDIDQALTVGSVAFFLAPGRRTGGLDRVFHIGVVTEIERDAQGRIQSYAMFHGRRPGFAASITRWHQRDRSPALGNGTERMVAVAWPADAALPDDLARALGEVVAETPHLTERSSGAM